MTSVRQRLETTIRDRYTIERELGQGGMAIVLLAHDVKHDRRVAVKVLRPEIATEIGAERFLREIKLAARLTHPHILPLHDSGEADGLLFYVMPYVPGESLRDRLTRERQLPLGDALEITRAVAAALDYAHRQGVIHRDIKPENILLHDGVALLADFGIGKALSAAGASSTQTGVALGTPAYMSPEQASGESEVDGRSDLYSLACVVYEMLAGEQPFTGPTIQAVIAKRFITPVPSLRTVRDVPEAVEAAVTRALARTPVDRFPSVAEFAEALRATGAPAVAPQRTPPESRRAAVSGQKAIAVLPFANMSPDPENEYFSDGMTEELMNALAKVRGVQVASRTSSFAFKGKTADVREIGDKLGVAAVLEGSVRKAGTRIRVTAQLTNVENGYRLWSETYDRQLEDVFAIQDEISRAIVDALRVQLSSDTSRLVVPATDNLEAYTMYLKGRFLFNKFTEADQRKGLDFFQRALTEDPGYARAHAGIADVWCTLADDWVAPEDAYPRAKAAAARALELEPALAEARTSVGKVLCWYEWDFTGAERELRQAVALNSNYAEAHFVLGSTLPALGQLDEAIAEMRRALVLDPLAPQHSRWLARFLLYARDYDAVTTQSTKTLELDPHYFQAYHDAAQAHLAQGRPAEALEWYRRGQAVEGAARVYDVHIVRALTALARRDEAARLLTDLVAQSREHYMRAEVLAMGHAALGALDEAFACLEQAFAAHSAGLIYLHRDPGYEPLRGDPRFASLVERVGVK